MVRMGLWKWMGHALLRRMRDERGSNKKGRGEGGGDQRAHARELENWRSRRERGEREREAERVKERERTKKTKKTVFDGGKERDGGAAPFFFSFLPSRCALVRGSYPEYILNNK